jgi:hypothetical protein
MSRGLLGVVVAVMVVWGPVTAAAQSAEVPRVAVTRRADRVTITARTSALRVSETVTRAGFELTLSDGRDAAAIAGDAAGRVSVRRGGRTLQLSLRQGSAAEVEAVRRLLGGSSAVAAFGRLLQSPWGRTSKEALAFASAHAIATLLQGERAPLTAIVQRLRVSQEPQIVRVRQMTASMCWRSYERDVLMYTYELENCIAQASNSLNPLSSAWCSYEYNLKATLAFVWLLDCSGY